MSFDYDNAEVEVPPMNFIEMQGVIESAIYRISALCVYREDDDCRCEDCLLCRELFAVSAIVQEKLKHEVLKTGLE
jgi:hypothetical protein